VENDTKQEGNGKCQHLCTITCIHICVQFSRTYCTVHAHERTREAPRVGIDGLVNIRAVRLVD